MKNINELKRMAEKFSEFYSTDYIRRVYNTHAASYNEKTPKREAFDDLKYVSDGLEKEMQEIVNHLAPYGFHPTDIIRLHIVKERTSLDHTVELLNQYLNKIGLSPEDFKPISDECERYLKLDMNWGPLQFLMFPDKVPLWDELSDNERDEITNRGNPNFINSQIDMPDRFYEDAKTLIDENPTWTQTAIAEELAETHFEGDSSKTRTIIRRLKDKGFL